MKLSQKVREQCCIKTCPFTERLALEIEQLEKDLNQALEQNDPEGRRKIRLDEAQKIRRAGSYQGERFKRFMIGHIDDLTIREQL